MSDQLERLKAAFADRYRIEREVGRGGMASVYLAEDIKHARKVAIKVLRPQLSSSLGAERFLREIEIASQLTHPHILPLYDSGVAEELLYFVMPYVEGESLAHRMAREKTLPIEYALQVTREVASALDYAHRRNIVHRDIKPENILLADEHAVVADFGIARAVGAAGGYSLTQSGLPIGTPRYMSPEQARGMSDVDGRSDIHSLGRVLYEMIVGEPPARPCDRSSVAEGRFTDQPPKHRAILESLPDRVVRALVQALAEHPDDRFPTAKQFSDKLGPPQRETAQWGAIPESKSSATRAAEIAALTLVGGAVVVGYITQRTGVSLPAILAVTLPLLGLAAAIGIWAYRRRREAELPATPTSGGRRRVAPSGPRETIELVESIAVLPFADMSPGQDQAYFSDGIAEELLNALARIEGLRVAARTSSFQFKGKNQDVRGIGEELGVETVLEGSVRKSGARVRITAQLVSAQDGFHLWSDTYDRELADIFAVQQEIAREIVDALRIKLPGGETPQAIAQPASDPEAHNLYLKGRYLWNQRTKAGLLQAAEFFRQATDRDPAYAAAHAGLADAYLLLGSYQHLAPAEALPLAKEAAERALGLDDTLAEAHATRGQVLRSQLEWDSEEREYRRAIQLNPSYATAHQWYATMLAAQGRMEEARREILRAAELDPLSHAISVTVGIVLFLAGDYDAAIEQLHKVREMVPDFFTVHAWLALACGHTGRHEEAARASESLRELNEAAAFFTLAYVHAQTGNREQALEWLDRAKERGERWAAVAVVFAALDEPDRALDCLERAFDEERWSFFTLHRTFLLYIKVAPWFEPLHAAPRFHAMLRRMKFPE